MIKSLCWNIRGITSNGAFDRLKQLKRQYNLGFIAVQEPFSRMDKLEKFRRRMGFHFSYANSSNKIWLFCEEEYNCTIIVDHEQHLTCQIKYDDVVITITIVYAKCDVQLREQLWNELRSISSNQTGPWMVMGDFNCILDPSEKRGGIQHNMKESLPLLECICDSDLIDMGYSGSTFTWCNGWAPDKRIWKRLDRVLANQEWIDQCNGTTITHLVRTGSDHAPMLITASNNIINPKKYFKFLNLWTKDDTFMDVVQQAWQEDFSGSPMWKFHLKLKNTCSKLSWWSRNCLGDIFENTKTMEKKVADLEKICIVNTTDVSRMHLNEANALLIRHNKQEEEFWRQKAGTKWFEEGDLNTKFFHSVIKSRRRRLMLNKIKKEDGSWLDNPNEIIDESIQFFQK
ncbi:uncharacterized protein LOC132619874 [Lycium barbarum]|uniref:uncharacterized protein LOC132619874 n=1 Tax=Lycium barbarum TaxID=112863 RepID=UPI00293E1A33|nr:uncharacterized protein LOC132619874 [Lycium barbarum]